MNLLDSAIIALMIFFIVRGIFRGFFREIGSLAGVILGLWLADLYQPQMTEHLKAYFPSVIFLPLIAFGIIFTVVMILCNLSGWGLKVILKKAFLGWADRALGACLAVFKGTVITYFAIVLLSFFVPPKTPFIAGSRLAPLITTSCQYMSGLISPNLYQNWKRKFLKDKKGIDEIVSKKIQTFNR